MRWKCRENAVKVKAVYIDLVAQVSKIRHIDFKTLRLNLTPSRVQGMPEEQVDQSVFFIVRKAL